MPERSGIAYSLHTGGNSRQEAPPVVFIHGAGGTRYHWPPNLRRLKGYAVYSLDLPGHGESVGPSERSIDGYARRVLGWVDSLELQPPVLAGHSMGGAISLWLALNWPERCSGLILVGTGGRLRVSPEILDRLSEPQAFPQVVERITAWSFSPSAPARLVELAKERMAEADPVVVHGDFLACDRFDILGRLQEIDLPALVLCGREDRMTPLKYSQALESQLGSANLETVGAAGHMVMLEQPQQVERHIQDFLRRLREGRSGTRGQGEG